MRQGKNKQSTGYTIAEVMVVLAVSGVIFLIAALFISGKQQTTSFKQGVNTMASDLQNIIEQVTDGNYTDSQFNCDHPIGTTSLNITTGTNTQGTNDACVFLGKVLHFQGNNSPDYEVFTVAGAQQDNLGNPPTDYSDALATVIDGKVFPVDLTVQNQVPEGLMVSNLTVNDASGLVDSYAFGFAQTFVSADTSGTGSGSYQSGAQNVSLVYAPGVGAGTNEYSAANDINGSSHLKTAVSARLCLTDGSLYATISVGDSPDNGNQLIVDTNILGHTPCA